MTARVLKPSQATEKRVIARLSLQPYIVNGSEQLTSDPYPLAPLVVPPTL